MKNHSFAASLMLVLPLTGCLLIGGANAGYEEPDYEVLEKMTEKIEIRRYDEKLAAEATVPLAQDRTNDNTAFRLLFRYISGENEPSGKIAMTTPVETKRNSQKIAMTNPVETSTENDETYTMRFFLPEKYTMETAPEPKDERVKLVTIPPETVAVYRTSGVITDQRHRQEVEVLEEFLSNTGWEPAGEPYLLRYDPPFTPPMFRRNETVIPVKAREK